MLLMQVNYIPISLSTKEIKAYNTLTYTYTDNHTEDFKLFSPGYLNVNHQVSLRLVRTDTRTQQVDQVPASWLFQHSLEALSHSSQLPTFSGCAHATLIWSVSLQYLGGTAFVQ